MSDSKDAAPICADEVRQLVRDAVADQLRPLLPILVEIRQAAVGLSAQCDLTAPTTARARVRLDAAADMLKELCRAYGVPDTTPIAEPRAQWAGKI